MSGMFREISSLLLTREPTKQFHSFVKWREGKKYESSARGRNCASVWK